MGDRSRGFLGNLVYFCLMLQAFFLFILGSSVGSFLASWAEKGSWLQTMRHQAVCRNCTLPLKSHHLLPVAGWLGLKGKCGHCKVCLPISYLLFEAGMGIVFVLLWQQHFGFGLEVLEATRFAWSLFFRDVFLLMVFALLFAYDLFHMELPDWITLPSIVVVAVWNLLLGMSVQDVLLGAVTLGGFFALQFVISRGRWVGGGDIRMGVLLGVALGPGFGGLAVGLSYILGSLVAVGMVLSGVANRKTALPFGTFLAVGGYVVLLWGEDILSFLHL